MITLWGRNNSTNVKKVRWVLEELDLPYQQILAGLEFGLNHDPEYLAMNPNGLVPLLKDDATGVVVWESNTIIRYRRPSMALTVCGWPRRQRAQGEKWMDWSNGTLSRPSPGINGLVRTPPEQRDPAAIAAGSAPAKRCSPCWTTNWPKRRGSPASSSALAILPSLLRLQSVVDPRQLATAAPSAALVSAD
nr:Glutathione S-transferase GstB [Klebsiella pneumoniae]